MIRNMLMPPSAQPTSAQAGASPMPGSPQPLAPQAQATPIPTPGQLRVAHHHASTVLQGLLALTGKPKGELSAHDVVDGMVSMIKAGAFPAPESRQALAGQVGSLPSDERALRRQLGQHVLAQTEALERLKALGVGGGPGVLGGGGGGAVNG